MKDKKIIAMFVTSCVALVASLVITLGVALTLADPVPAAEVLRCEFNFGAENSSDIIADGNVLTFDDAILFQPTGSLHVENWDPNTMDTDDKVGSPLYFDMDGAHPTYLSKLQYENEALPSKVKFATIRVSNATAHEIKVSVDTAYATESTLSKYMVTYVFDCETYSYFSYDNAVLANPEFKIAAGEYRDFIMMVYVDEYNNTQGETIEYGSANEYVDIVVKKV